MPRFRVLSDLHLDLRDDVETVVAGLAANEPHADCLVLAGDVAEARWPGLRPFLVRVAAAYDHLVYVPGNHEYYNGRMDLVDAQLATLPGHLNRGERDVGGVRVLGCTLWTALAPHVNPLIFNDCGRIRVRDDAFRRSRLFGRDDLAAAHGRDVRWLDRALDRGPALVVTHHAPVMGDSSAEMYRGSDHETFFASRVGDELGPRTLGWVFGHTHHAATLSREGYTLWTNALGYPGEATGFRDLVVEVAPGQAAGTMI